MIYYSQSWQDRFLDLIIFKKKENGFFVDIGAYDGKTLSNTLFFETRRNWTGICVEPIPSSFEKLINNRNCKCINACIGESEEKVSFIHIIGDSEMLSGICNLYDKRHIERIEKEINENCGNKEIIEVQSYKLDTILRQNNVKNIDYLSIDAEGSEKQILEDINFSENDIKVLTVENNYNDNSIRVLLKNNGYVFIGKLDADDVFILNSESRAIYKIMVLCFNYTHKVLRKFFGYE